MIVLFLGTAPNGSKSFSAWLVRIDNGAAGEAHARGEADGDVGYDSFHHPGTLCYADDGVVEFSTTRGPTATSSVVVGFGRSVSI